MHNNAHEFAFYYKELIAQDLKKNSSLTIKNKDLCSRIKNIVRLNIGESCTLFDGKKQVIRIMIEKISDKELAGIVVEVIPHQTLLPKITWLLPVLKKAALEEACHNLSVLGAQKIQLIVTDKTHRPIPELSSLAERLTRIMVAAAEQAKQYTLPIILNPIPLKTALAQGSSLCSEASPRMAAFPSTRLFFDPEGRTCSDVIGELKTKNVQEIICLIGPEGDLSPEEKIELQKYNFVSCALTPTILRAEDALTLATGIIRSFLPNTL